MKTVKVKPGSSEMGLQKSSPGTLPPAQNTSHQSNPSVPHGNSLALAKECIYCIAKKICLQSTLPKTCKTSLAERFGKLTPLSQTQTGLGSKLSNSTDNTWAKKIVVKIFQDEGVRRVMNPNEVLSIDAGSSQKAEGELHKERKPEPSQPQIKFDRVSRNLQSQDIFENLEPEKPQPERVSVFNYGQDVQQEVAPFNKATGRGVSQFLVNEEERAPD